jgi:hypothetical protein
VFVREESIMIPLHIIKAAATETQACFKGCIFYAIFYGGMMTPMDIVPVQLVCLLFFIPREGAHPRLPVSVLQGVRVLVANILHSCVLIHVVVNEDPH